MNLFWVAFHEILPQMSSNLYKSFSNDAIKKNEFLTRRVFRLTVSWRYIIVVSFISIAFVVVKLRISKVLRTNSTSTKQSFLGGFWALTLPIWSNIAEILTRGSALANKNTVWILVLFWMIRVFMEKGRTQSYHYGLPLTPFFLLKMVKVEKKYAVCGKTSVIELSKYVKIKSLSPLPFSGKIRLLFAIFRIFLPGNTAGSQVKGVESKCDKYYFIHTIPDQLPIKKFWF